MTLGDAIRLLRRDIDNPGAVDIMDVNKAEQLGIEALKWLKDWRRGIYLEKADLLPGETE